LPAPAPEPVLEAAGECQPGHTPLQRQQQQQQHELEPVLIANFVERVESTPSGWQLQAGAPQVPTGQEAGGLLLVENARPFPPVHWRESALVDRLSGHHENLQSGLATG